MRQQQRFTLLALLVCIVKVHCSMEKCCQKMGVFFCSSSCVRADKGEGKRGRLARQGRDGGQASPDHARPFRDAVKSGREVAKLAREGRLSVELSSVVPLVRRQSPRKSHPAFDQYLDAHADWHGNSTASPAMDLALAWCQWTLAVTQVTPALGGGTCWVPLYRTPAEEEQDERLDEDGHHRRPAVATLARRTFGCSLSMLGAAAEGLTVLANHNGGSAGPSARATPGRPVPLTSLSHLLWRRVSGPTLPLFTNYAAQLADARDTYARLLASSSSSDALPRAVRSTVECAGVPLAACILLPVQHAVALTVITSVGLAAEQAADDDDARQQHPLASSASSASPQPGTDARFLSPAAFRLALLRSRVQKVLQDIGERDGVQSLLPRTFTYSLPDASLGC